MTLEKLKRALELTAAIDDITSFCSMLESGSIIISRQKDGYTKKLDNEISKKIKAIAIEYYREKLAKLNSEFDNL